MDSSLTMSGTSNLINLIGISGIKLLENPKVVDGVTKVAVEIITQGGPQFIEMTKGAFNGLVKIIKSTLPKTTADDSDSPNMTSLKIAGLTEDGKLLASVNTDNQGKIKKPLDSWEIFNQLLGKLLEVKKIATPVAEDKISKSESETSSSSSSEGIEVKTEDVPIEGHHFGISDAVGSIVHLAGNIADIVSGLNDKDKSHKKEKSHKSDKKPKESKKTKSKKNERIEADEKPSATESKETKKKKSDHIESSEKDSTGEQKKTKKKKVEAVDSEVKKTASSSSSTKKHSGHSSSKTKKDPID